MIKKEEARGDAKVVAALQRAGHDPTQEERLQTLQAEAESKDRRIEKLEQLVDKLRNDY